MISSDMLSLAYVFRTTGLQTPTCVVVQIQADTGLVKCFTKRRLLPKYKRHFQYDTLLLEL